MLNGGSGHLDGNFDSQPVIRFLNILKPGRIWQFNTQGYLKKYSKIQKGAVQ